MICRLSIRSFNSDNEHPVIHRFIRIMMMQRFPCNILEDRITQSSEQLCPMIVQLIERMISIRHFTI